MKTEPAEQRVAAPELLNAHGKPLFPATVIMMACPQCIEARPWPLNCGHGYAEWFSREYVAVDLASTGAVSLPDGQLRAAAEEIQSIVIEDVDKRRLQSVAFKERIVNVLRALSPSAGVGTEDALQVAAFKRIAVLHSIGISGTRGSINDFWERLISLSTDERIDFCQALHQLCETVGHNNENRCYLCEKIGARNAEGSYTGDRFFDGTKNDYT